MKQYSEFLNEVDFLQKQTGEPWGQAFFNALVHDRPVLAENIRGTDLDPFYFDKSVRTAQAIKYAGDRWNDF